MRRSPARLLDPLTLPGALVRGLEAQFADVVSEPLPGPVAALMRRLREVQNDAAQNNALQNDEAQTDVKQPDREDDQRS